MDKIYDVIILGAGPGGLAAGIYAGRARLDTLLIEKGKDGGQIAITDEIENYPGQMVDGESGPSLIERMTKQVEKFGAERVSDTIVSVDIEGPVKTLVGSNGTYKARTLIIATGAFPRPIGCKGEGEFMGKGVSYCATCDASFFEDLEVFVVGGGDGSGKLLFPDGCPPFSVSGAFVPGRGRGPGLSQQRAGRVSAVPADGTAGKSGRGSGL